MFKMFNVALLVPIIAIIFGCGIAIVAIIAGYKEKKKYYEALVRAIEVGKNSEEVKALFGQPQRSEFDPAKYIKNGIITIGVGIGLAIMGWVTKTVELVGGGGFLCVLGLSFLSVHFLLNKNKKSK